MTHLPQQMLWEKSSEITLGKFKKLTITSNIWLESANIINITSFIVNEKITKKGKPFTKNE